MLEILYENAIGLPCECVFLFQSFTTLVNNALRVAAINSVGDFILFLGKIGVMAATAAVGILWFKVR